MQEQGSGPQTGKQKVQEGMKGPEEEEGGEMQVGLVELQVCASLGVWEEEWGTRWGRGDEEGEQAGSGVRR